MTEYAPAAIEEKWQRYWRERDVFKARPHAGEKYYCYNPAPYVTGDLHMGHVRNYTYGDFLSKYKRLHGANVLYTIGFDAFGVPTEQAAMRERMDPAGWTARCIEGMRGQMMRLGLGFDWDRSFCTADPDYYRWTQWIFIEMFRDGLVYERHAESLWCPQCRMALAKSLTIEGRCGQCGATVERRWTPQWFLRISDYLDRLRADLEEVRDHNGQAKAGQESLLARRSLWGVPLEIPKLRTSLLAHMESPADWSGKLVLAVHPEDSDTRLKLGLGPGGAEGGDAAGAEGARPVSGLAAIEPRSSRAFAVVIDRMLDAVYADRPRLMPLPEQPSGRETWEAPPGGFLPLTAYEQKDFSISRQRIWGTPVPMIRCPACGPVPVAPGDLPVLLPEMELDDAGRLRRSGAGQEARDCPSCGGTAAPDPQVLDCHFDALWHYCRPCVTSCRVSPFESEELKYWMPVDQIQFGRDTIPCLLTMRLFSKFLQDRGLLSGSEFARETLAHGLILKDNRKMSKHIGNVVNPLRIMESFGADSLRFYVLAKAEPRSDYCWSDGGIAPYRDLLGDFHDDLAAYAGAAPEDGDGDSAPGAGPTKYTRVFLAKVLREVSILETCVEDGRFDIYARAVARLLTALHVFRSRYYEAAGREARAAWARCCEQSVVYLAPIAPHLAEECWERLGSRGSVFEGRHWPASGKPEVKRLLELAMGEGSGESRQRMRPVA
jgi:leucyl-tRNA synthetase